MRRLASSEAPCSSLLRLRCLLVAGALACAAAAPPVLAKPRAGKSQSAKKTAQRLNKAGKKAFRAGQYEKAVVAFEAAYQVHPLLKYIFNAGRAAEEMGDLDRAVAQFVRAYEADPLPTFLYNAATIREKQGSFDLAVELLDRFLASEDAADSEREDAETRRALVQAKLLRSKVRLELGSSPAGAAFVLAAGERRLEGKTPFQAWVEPGEYRLTVTHDGHQAHQQQLAIEPADAPTVLQVELVREQDEKVRLEDQR